MGTKFANFAPNQQITPCLVVAESQLKKNVPWIGCNHENQTEKQCDYWVHATCLGFPEAEDETFQNIFRCPPYNRANITLMNSKRKKTSSLWKQQNSFLL